jgi:hypothetical protein
VASGFSRKQTPARDFRLKAEATQESLHRRSGERRFRR